MQVFFEKIIKILKYYLHAQDLLSLDHHGRKCHPFCRGFTNDCFSLRLL